MEQPEPVQISLYSIDLNEEWVRRREAMEQRCQRATEQAVLSSNLEELGKEYGLPHVFNPPDVKLAELYGNEPQIDARSVASASLHIPFSGDGHLLQVYHRTRPMHLSRPRYTVWVSPGLLTLRVQAQQHELVEATNHAREDVSKLVGQYLPEVRKLMLDHYNPRFQQAATSWFLRKKQDLEEKQKVKVAFGGLGFPIHKRTDPSAQAFEPVVRKVLPLPETTKPEENKSLETRAYEDILTTITAMGHGIERSPATFAEMKEEDIRMVLLIGLNAIYEGKATGETFNGYGKCDILIRVGDKNIFIAECLVWRGVEYLKSKIEPQLFNYAMWRDTKTALIVFNRNRNFSSVLAQSRATLKAHSQCIRELESTDTTTKYIFKRHDDPNQHFHLTLLAFDVAPSTAVTERQA